MKDVWTFLANEIVAKENPDLNPLKLAESAGLPAFEGAELDLLFRDHRAKPEVGRSEAAKLIEQDNVVALLGALNSGVTKTVQQVAQEKNVPLINTVSSSPDLTRPEVDWMWRTYPHDGIFAKNQVQFAADVSEEYDPDIETAVVQNVDNEFGNATAREQIKNLEETDIELEEHITYSGDIRSYDAQTDRLKQIDPDVVFHTGLLRDGIMIAETWRDRDYLPRLPIHGGGLTVAEWYEDNADLAQYWTGRTTFVEEMKEKMPHIEKYENAMRDSVGFGFGGNSIGAFGGLITLAWGLNEAGSTNGEDLKEVFDNMNLKAEEVGLPYDVEFDDTGQNVQATGLLEQTHDSKLRIVWPFDLAGESVFVYPVPGWDER
jgi:branched-chain amino acid transport system substrate-binding protein